MHRCTLTNIHNIKHFIFLRLIDKLLVESLHYFNLFSIIISGIILVMVVLILFGMLNI